ncbi:MAG: glycosyltransferase family protein [Nitrospiraceae bacterium]|nr:glycosyltransferase family protein [Nitrospiraceae bacterium]
MKTGAIIQARMSSTRLPGKVLKELPFDSGTSVLQQVIRRIRKSKKVDDIIVATTTGREDDVIARIAGSERAKCFRGSKEDVLGRYYKAAVENGVDVIVRITSDCPCVDPEVVDRVISQHIGTGADYTSNVLVRTFPHGLDVEALKFSALERAYLEAKEPFEREHVCPYIYASNPDRFTISSIEAEPDVYSPDIRITLDTEEDYTLLCAVFDFLYPYGEFFGIADIVRLFRAKPWLKKINQKKGR